MFPAAVFFRTRTMSEKVAITGVFLDPTVTVKAKAPKTMKIETAVGKLLTDVTRKAGTAYQLGSLSEGDMTIQYCPGGYAAPSFHCH